MGEEGRMSGRGDPRFNFKGKSKYYVGRGTHFPKGKNN
jgi:hypothetical protein